MEERKKKGVGRGSERMFRGSSPLLSPSCSALAVAIAIALSASVRASKMQHALKHIGKGDSDELREIKVCYKS